MEYGFIRDQAKAHPVSLVGQMLRVQRIMYYDWRDRTGKFVRPEELNLRRGVKALFVGFRESLGSCAMAKNLRQEGIYIGRDKARHLMNRLGLQVKPKRKHKMTTYSNHHLPAKKEAIADVRGYVAVYFNSKRSDSTLGCSTPMNYEKRLN